MTRVYINPAQRFAVDWGDDGARFAVFVQGEAEDSYGRAKPIKVFIRPRCQHCKKPATVAVKYTNGVGGIGEFLKSKGIDWTKGNLIMKNPRYPIGIPCGCYGRFQRQITHLETVVERNELKKQRTEVEAERDRFLRNHPPGGPA